jgi:hypothetical protein
MPPVRSLPPALRGPWLAVGALAALVACAGVGCGDDDYGRTDLAGANVDLSVPDLTGTGGDAASD